MKNTIHLAIIMLAFFSMSLSFSKLLAQKRSKNPSFIDKGKVIDSLKTVYNCEAIEYNNFDETQSDACLTVCLINSTIVPSSTNIDQLGRTLKGIANAIYLALANPSDYKSVYIIFVKKYIENGMTIKVHTTGMELLTSEF